LSVTGGELSVMGMSTDDSIDWKNMIYYYLINLHQIEKNIMALIKSIITNGKINREGITSHGKNSQDIGVL
jgi:hypothetical protein